MEVKQRLVSRARVHFVARESMANAGQLITDGFELTLRVAVAGSSTWRAPQMASGQVTKFSLQLLVL